MRVCIWFILGGVVIVGVMILVLNMFMVVLMVVSCSCFLVLKCWNRFDLFMFSCLVSLLMDSFESFFIEVIFIVVCRICVWVWWLMLVLGMVFDFLVVFGECIY